MSIERIIDNNFSGAVLIKRDKDMIFQKAFGYANFSDCIQNEINTKFAMASGRKGFTAVARL